MSQSKKSPERAGSERPAPPTTRPQAEILECDIPAELPVIPLASTVVFPQMVVNLQVARELALTIPPALLVRADEVIE